MKSGRREGTPSWRGTVSERTEYQCRGTKRRGTERRGSGRRAGTPSWRGTESESGVIESES